MTDITDQIAAWEPFPDVAIAYKDTFEAGGRLAEQSRDAYAARLRTADAIIERVADVSCACDLIGCEHDEARAYLAAREKER